MIFYSEMYVTVSVWEQFASYLLSVTFMFRATSLQNSSVISQPWKFPFFFFLLQQGDEVLWRIWKLSDFLGCIPADRTGVCFPLVASPPPGEHTPKSTSNDGRMLEHACVHLKRHAAEEQVWLTDGQSVVFQSGHMTPVLSFRLSLLLVYFFCRYVREAPAPSGLSETCALFTDVPSKQPNTWKHSATIHCP